MIMDTDPKLPRRIRLQQWLFARAAAVPFLPHYPSYALTIGREPRFVWFQVAKVATRSALNHFETHGVAFDVRQGYDLYFSPRLYRPHFKFSFVRNPWDRLVSCWQNKIIDNRKAHIFGSTQESLDSFTGFVDHVAGQDLSSCNIHIRLQCVQMDLNHLDFLGRFERFADDFRLVCGKLGLPGELERRLNASSRRPDYRTYYTPELAARVGALYRRDIDLFGYAFDPDPLAKADVNP